MKSIFNEITIVLISYRSKKKIVRFIKKLDKKFKILIIENSEDRNLHIFLKRKNIKIIYKNNIGYASSINTARKHIDTKYFFIFNPDVYGITNNIIEKFYLSAISLKDNFSCLGPRYKNISTETLKQSNKNLKIGKILSISGAAMFFCKKNFDYLKGFDENFFLYFEETDYCYRGNKQKLYAYQLNNISIRHNRGTSINFKNKKEKEKIKNLTNWHFIWSKFYFYKKNYGYFISLIYFVPILLRTAIKYIYFDIINKPDNANKYRVRLSGLINSILLKRSLKRI